MQPDERSDRPATPVTTIGDLVAAVDTVPCPSLVVDNGAVVHASPDSCRLLGYERADLVGRSIAELVAEPPSPSAWPTGNGPAPVQLDDASCTVDVRGSDGLAIPIELTTRPVALDTRRLAVVALNDVGARRREEALQRAVDELERTNRQLREFASIASHDLQAPLRSIMGFAQMIEDADLLEPPADGWLRRIISATRHMQALTSALLTLAKADEGDPTGFASVDLTTVVDEVVELHDATIRELGAEVRGEGLPIVLGDHGQLVQLVLNLVGNALTHHGPDAPIVAITASRRGRCWRISVSDNGVGIDPADQERIFEAFNRATQGGEVVGTGLGLAIARAVVHRHGGEITVESAPGAGATFTFTLPAVGGDLPAVPSRD